MKKMGRVIKIVVIAAILFAEGAIAASPKIVSSSGRANPGQPNFSIAVNRGGQVLTWGDNRYGQLGDGTTNSKLSPPANSGVK